ncbi:uncharacterized protein LOC133722068 isoform X2 [Rosa rugosa]|uniref:uncharacterized protein LOC133722068 isoform X2 n=1 Tax=Rosa rugosa TaxID=74645 RepID=UPI002B4056C1|nr:uncharacterized protein LOC133722068 isoform X2 [Rosa rugosa]
MFVSQYAYSAIQYVSGSQVHPAQILFGVLYIINLGIHLYIYVKTDVVSKIFEPSCGSFKIISVSNIFLGSQILDPLENRLLRERNGKVRYAHMPNILMS